LKEAGSAVDNENTFGTDLVNVQPQSLPATDEEKVIALAYDSLQHAIRGTVLLGMGLRERAVQEIEGERENAMELASLFGVNFQDACDEFAHSLSEELDSDEMILAISAMLGMLLEQED
jgi:hypothetical protein